MSVSIMKQDKLILLKIRNKELLKSLLYQLGIKFRTVLFDFNESTSNLEHNCDDTEIQKQIQEHIFEFENANLRIGNRVQSQTVWRANERAKLKERMPPESSIQSHPGLWCHFDEIGDIALALSKAFEDKVRILQPKNISVPRLVQKPALVKMGHLPKEAHQIAFLTVPEREENEFALTPAVCLPCYVALEGKNLDGPRIYTFEGIAHRYEGGVFSKDSLARIREFKVREVVCFGGEAELQRLQSFFINTCKDFANIFELPASVGTATDLFFHNEGASQAFHQLIHQSKLEFKIELENKEMAVASFNSHGNHFTKTFNIGDISLRSFCIGFGIDRLAYAVYCMGYSVQEINNRLNDFKDLKR